MTWLAPSPDYRYEFKRGDAGTDVAALQINLDAYGVTVDGSFGPETEAAVKQFQTDAGLFVDGVAGHLTQKKLVYVKSGPFGKKYALPQGLLVSIADHESSFYVAAYSPHPSDPGFDLGAYQNSLGPEPTQDEIRFSYDLAAMADNTGAKVRRQHDIYAEPWPVDSWYLESFSVAGGSKGHLAWQLAVLFHNWETAADNIWSTGYIYKNHDKELEPIEWVEVASGGRLKTPREWVVDYIDKATAHVVWPT